MKLHHKLYGEGPETLFILHGLFGMLDNWHMIASRLSEDLGLRVIAVDQRNHGYSPHSDEMNYILMAIDLLELMNELHIDQCHLMGHSMGGKTAMTFAALHPEKLKSLIVVDIAPKAYGRGHDFIFDALFDLHPETCQSRNELEERLSRHISDNGIRLFLMKNLIRKTGEEGYAFKMNLQAIHQAYDKISGEVEIGWPVALPTLFILGDRSPYVKSSDEGAILQSFPEAEFVRIPNSGHWVHAENPNGFIDALELFLSNI